LRGRTPEIDGVECPWERHADVKSPCVFGRDAPCLLRYPPYLRCPLGTFFHCVSLLCLPIEVLIEVDTKIFGAGDQLNCSLWEL
jgi:hypothetical protein